MSSDAEVEARTSAILTALRRRLSALPLREALVEALGVEARPAVQAMLFATSVERASDVISLEHHETLAMMALLGRACAVEDITPSAAHGLVPAFLGAFEDEGIVVEPPLVSALSIIYLEGFLRGRDERFAARADARALRAIEILSVASGVGMVVIGGEHDDDALMGHLEGLARNAFRAELVVVVVVASASDPPPERARGAILGFVELLSTVGIGTVLARFAGPTPEGAAVFDDLPAALGHAIRLANRPTGTLSELRALFRGLGARRPST